MLRNFKKVQKQIRLIKRSQLELCVFIKSKKSLANLRRALCYASCCPCKLSSFSTRCFSTERTEKKICGKYVKHFCRSLWAFIFDAIERITDPPQHFLVNLLFDDALNRKKKSLMCSKYRKSKYIQFFRSRLLSFHADNISIELRKEKKIEQNLCKNIKIVLASSFSSLLRFVLSIFHQKRS